MPDPFPAQRFENVSAAVIIDCLLQIFRVTGEENDVGLAVYGSELSGQPEPVHMIIQFYIQKSDGNAVVLRELQRFFPAAEVGLLQHGCRGGQVWRGSEGLLQAV